MPASPAKLNGELELIGLYDVCQLLMLNRATGRLALEQGGKRAALLFREGRIVNAVDEELREGEGAAFRVFTWKKGKFEFIGEPVGPGEALMGSTEGLMLEAARRQDEASEAAGETAGSEARLRERQGSMEALRDVFRDATRGARTADSPEIGALGLGDDVLRHAGDRVVLRPGDPVRVFSNGEWSNARSAEISRAEYEDLRVRLLGAPGLGEAMSGARITQTFLMPGGRTVAATFVASGRDEALWLRPLMLPVLDSARLRDSKSLSHVLEHDQAIIVVCGDDFEIARELIHVVVADLQTHPDENVVLVRELPVYRHEHAGGLLTECVPADVGRVLAAVQADTLALDLDRPLPEGSLPGYGSLRRLVVRVSGTTAQSVNATWRMSFAPHDRELVHAHTLGWPGFLARVIVAEEGTGRIEVRQLAAGTLSGATATRVGRGGAAASAPAAEAA